MSQPWAPCGLFARIGVFLRILMNGIPALPSGIALATLGSAMVYYIFIFNLIELATGSLEIFLIAQDVIHAAAYFERIFEHLPMLTVARV